MNTPDERKQQDLHRARMLNDEVYLKKIIMHMVDERVSFVGDCYPLTSEHIQEALTQCLPHDLVWMVVSWSSAAPDLNFGHKLKRQVEAYWRGVAEHLVKKDLGL